MLSDISTVLSIILLIFLAVYALNPIMKRALRFKGDPALPLTNPRYKTPKKSHEHHPMEGVEGLTGKKTKNVFKSFK